MKVTVALKLVAITLLAISTHFVSAGGDEDLWKDFNDQVSENELREGFKKKNIELTDAQVKDIIHVADYNNDGTLSKTEFICKAVPFFKYKDFDKDGNGYITKNELKEGFQKHNVELKPEREEEIFRIADENHDGKINYREFIYNILPYFKFDTFDKDKSGSLTKEEIKNGFAAHSITMNDVTLEHVFQVGDRNNDNHISYTEYVHRVEYFFLFDELDKDKSGSIATDELKEGLAKHGITLTDDKAKELIDIADLNDDGTVVYREFLHEIYPYFRFIKIDKNHDGELTKEELGEGLYILGVILYENRLNALIKFGDTNGDNLINYAEYVRKVDAIFYFRRFDENNNGLLDKTELKEGFELHGLSLDATQHDDLFAVADSIRKDKHIDYEEFVRKTYPYFVFRKFDTDKTGCISKDELQKGMKYHGIDLQGEKLEDLFNTANTDNKSNISFSEFIDVIEPYFRFIRLDENKCGEIDADELSSRAFLFGKKLTKEQAQALINEADQGAKNGKLDLKEYLKIDSKIV